MDLIGTLITQKPLTGTIEKQKPLIGTLERLTERVVYKSDHYISSISSAASLKTTKTAVCEAASAGVLSKTKSTVYQYEIITEEE